MAVNKIIIICAVLHILSIVLFIYGFLPAKKSIPGYSNGVENSLNINKNQSLVQFRLKTKIILLVIDALKAGFIPAVASNTYEPPTMPFLEQMIREKHTLTYISRTHSPTVTLPRLKAMMSGTIPAFMDVILNLHATESEEDSLLYQAHKANHKIVFFGDDTWIKLFGRFFKSYEGTSSFFVNDFIEVDHNVSRHLNRVLKLPDWDLLILHYLGLDHIGHLAGESSAYIRPKLKEMDDVVKLLHASIKGQRSLLVITGDHGMTPSGSHGGASVSEITTPLIFLTNEDKGSNQIGEVMQVDIASTLSVVMGVPIPKNNIGKIIPAVLESIGLPSETILQALFNNAHQVASVLRENNLFVLEEQLKTANKVYKAWLQNKEDDVYTSLKVQYSMLIRLMGEKLELVASGYDVYCMILGLVTSVGTLFCILRIASPKGIAALEEEMIYTKVMVIIPCFIISCVVHLISVQHSELSIFKNLYLWPIPIFLITFSMYHILQCSYLFPSVVSGQNISMGIELFVVGGALAHVVSLASSSLIEEEHQTWYFLSTTLIILLFVRNTSHIIRSFDVTLETGFMNRKSPGNFSAYRTALVKRVFYCLCFLTLFRLSRSWNQSGNKWAHLPDVGDFLREDNKLLSLLIVMSSFILFALLRTQRLLQQSCLLLSLLATDAYHLEAVATSGASANKQIIAWVVYSCIVVHTAENMYYIWTVKIGQKYARIKLCKLFLNGSATSWILLALLLCRPYNFPLYLLVIFQERLLRKLLWKEPISFFICTSAYLWTAMSSFYYQGNSNMLSTLDVSSGYVGLTSYQPAIIAMLMIFNTYSSLGYFLLQYLSQTCHSIVTQIPFSSVTASHVAALLGIRFFCISVYLAVVIYLRHHLFIWTVFAPKLLYESTHSLFFTSFYLTILIITVFSKNSKV